MDSNMTKCLKIYKNQNKLPIEEVSNDCIGSIFDTIVFGSIFYTLYKLFF
jgi:hypothetical protein